MAALVRKKPCVKLSSALRDEINTLAEKRKIQKNEALEMIVRIGLAAYYSQQTLKAS